MSHKKTDRNQLLIDYHKAHPEAKLRVMAELFRISRERVRAILAKHREEVSNG